MQVVIKSSNMYISIVLTYFPFSSFTTTAIFNCILCYSMQTKLQNAFKYNKNTSIDVIMGRLYGLIISLENLFFIFKNFNFSNLCFCRVGVCFFYEKTMRKNQKK